MPNMSYCRFELTLSDMEDCLEALQQADSIKSMDLSSDELRALVSMISTAEDIVSIYTDLRAAEDDE